MRNLQRKLQGLFGQYSFSIVSLAGFGVNFIQSFIFAAILEKEFFGQVFLVMSLFTTFSYLFVFGLDSAMMKFYFDDQFSDKRLLRSTIFFTWLKYSAILFIVLTIVGFIAIEVLDFSSIKFYSEYVLLLVSGLFFSFLLIIQQYFVAARNVVAFALSTFGARLALLLSNIGALLFGGLHLSFVVYSFAITCTAMFVIALIGFRIEVSVDGKSAAVKEIRKFSMPLILNGLISVSFSNGYRVLVSSMLSFASLAVYGIINQVATAYYVALTALLLPQGARAYEYLQSNPDKSAIRSYQGKTLLFGIPGLALTVVAAYFVLHYFKAGLYEDGFPMLPILLFGQFVFAMYSHEYIVLSFFKKTSRIALSTSIGIALILSMVYFFVTTWQLWGACLVVFFGFTGQYLAARYFRTRISFAS